MYKEKINMVNGPLTKQLCRLIAKYLRTGNLPNDSQLQEAIYQNTRQNEISGSSVTTVESFKKCASELALNQCGVLIHGATGKAIIPAECVTQAVLHVHTGGNRPGEEHLSYGNTIQEYGQKYSLEKLHYGVGLSSLKSIVKQCPAQKCKLKHYFQRWNSRRSTEPEMDKDDNWEINKNKSSTVDKQVIPDSKCKTPKILLSKMKEDVINGTINKNQTSSVELQVTPLKTKTPKILLSKMKELKYVNVKKRLDPLHAAQPRSRSPVTSRLRKTPSSQAAAADRKLQKKNTPPKNKKIKIKCEPKKKIQDQPQETKRLKLEKSEANIIISNANSTQKNTECHTKSVSSSETTEQKSAGKSESAESDCMINQASMIQESEYTSNCENYVPQHFEFETVSDDRELCQNVRTSDKLQFIGNTANLNNSADMSDSYSHDNSNYLYAKDICTTECLDEISPSCKVVPCSYLDKGMNFSDKVVNYVDKGVNFFGKDVNFSDKCVNFSGKDVNFTKMGVNYLDKGLNFSDKSVKFSDKGVNLSLVKVDDGQLWQHTYIYNPVFKAPRNKQYGGMLPGASIQPGTQIEGHDVLLQGQGGRYQGQEGIYKGQGRMNEGHAAMYQSQGEIYQGRGGMDQGQGGMSQGHDVLLQGQGGMYYSSLPVKAENYWSEGHTNYQQPVYVNRCNQPPYHYESYSLQSLIQSSKNVQSVKLEDSTMLSKELCGRNSDFTTGDCSAWPIHCYENLGNTEESFPKNEYQLEVNDQALFEDSDQALLEDNDQALLQDNDQSLLQDRNLAFYSKKKHATRAYTSSTNGHALFLESAEPTHDSAFFSNEEKQLSSVSCKYNTVREDKNGNLINSVVSGTQLLADSEPRQCRCIDTELEGQVDNYKFVKKSRINQNSETYLDNYKELLRSSEPRQSGCTDNEQEKTLDNSQTACLCSKQNENMTDIVREEILNTCYCSNQGSEQNEVPREGKNKNFVYNETDLDIQSFESRSSKCINSEQEITIHNCQTAEKAMPSTCLCSKQNENTTAIVREEMVKTCVCSEQGSEQKEVTRDRVHDEIVAWMEGNIERISSEIAQKVKVNLRQDDKIRDLQLQLDLVKQQLDSCLKESSGKN